MNRFAHFSILVICATTLVLFACAAHLYHIPPEIRTRIPERTYAVRLYSALPPNAYFDVIRDHLASSDFAVTQWNKEMGTMETEFKDIRDGIILKVYVDVVEKEGGTRATLKGSWSRPVKPRPFGSVLVEESCEAEAIWYRSWRAEVAFGELAMIANAIENDRLEYVVKE